MGAVAQLGEHLLCKQGVTGSIPVSSTKILTGTVRRRCMRSITSLGPFLIPITAIVVVGVVAIIVVILRHQERIAKIEHGIDPDRPQR